MTTCHYYPISPLDSEFDTRKFCQSPYCLPDKVTLGLQAGGLGGICDALIEMEDTQENARCQFVTVLT